MEQVNINLYSGSLETTKTDLLALFLFEKQQLAESIKRLDKKLNGELSRTLSTEKFSGKIKESVRFSTLGLIAPKNILLVGLGKKEKFSQEALRRVCSVVCAQAKGVKAENFAILLANSEVDSLLDAKSIASASYEGSILGLYSFDKYKNGNNKNSAVTDKSSKTKTKSVKSVTFIIGKQDERKFKEELSRTKIVVDSVLWAREMVNEIPNIATPTYLAEQAKKLTKKGIKVTIFGKSEIIKKGMNALYAVAKGSVQEPKFIIMEYKPAAKDKIALIGKGITFDSGGMNLKPTNYIEDMKCDMSGAASVIATMSAIAQLKPSHGVVGVVPTCENIIGASAYKPGDILISYNKKTIEVLNTDAEGRLILADALGYTVDKIKPKGMVTIATLTGACVVALGVYTSALISNNDNLIKQIKESSIVSGDAVWQLPLNDDYRERVESDIADVRNTGKGKGGEAGTITAGAFLENFAGDIPWAHLDIAGTAFISEAKDYNAKGATGAPTRLLIDFAEKWK